MTFPPADLSYLRERLRELTAQAREAWETSPLTDAGSDSPALLGDALLQLVDMLGHIQNADPDSGANPAEIHTLGEYGLNLLDELAQFAARLEHARLATDIEGLSLPLALWLARHGGEIRHMSPVVNALAQVANEVQQPASMIALYAQCCELVDACSPVVAESVSTDPRHPWRLLLLNRAIVATRSHSPELMEPAFDAIVELLPQDAQRFFSEGMEQMTIIDYPDHVCDMVRRYFLAHAAPRCLH